MGINIEAEPVEVLDVTLVGKEYKIRPPKAATLMEITSGMEGKDDDDMSLDELQKFIDVLFSKTDAKAVQKRLLNREDNLDIGHIMKLMNAVMEEATKGMDLPTTS